MDRSRLTALIAVASAIAYLAARALGAATALIG